MKHEKTPRTLNFPQNKEIASKLISGDREIIAKNSGYAKSTISDMLYGYRRLTDPVKLAIIKLMDERQKLNKSLEEITNQ